MLANYCKVWGETNKPCNSPGCVICTAKILHGLNPDIVQTVKWLREKGFKTTDSGDGTTHEFKCDLPIPYVHMVVDPSSIAHEADRLAFLLNEADRLAFLLNEEFGIDVKYPGTSYAPGIECSYSPSDGIAVLSLYNVML